MRMKTFGAMTAVILVIAIICVTGLVSALPPIGQPTEPPIVVAPPPTVTPTPTRLPVVEPPVIEPPIAVLPTSTPTVLPTVTLTPTVTPTVTPTQTLTSTATPTQTRTAAAPLQPSTTSSPQNGSAGAGIQVSGGPADEMYPAISGNSIVWVYNDSLNESISVQLHNTSSGSNSTISNATSVPLDRPYQLAVAGNNVVWSGINPQTGYVNIYLYDTDSGRLQQVTEDGPGMQLNPDVSQDYIIWTNLTNESSDVYLYEIASGDIIPMVTPLSYQTETAIGGNTTAWADNTTAGGDFDIVVAPLGKLKGVTLGDSGDDRHPDISSDGRYVAWINVLDNRSAVYLYDVEMANATRITGDSARPDAVAVDGNLVVYSDLRSGNHDIYTYDITAGTETPVTQDQYDQSYPDVSNGEIVWMGNDTGQWEIYRASAGG